MPSVLALPDDRQVREEGVNALSRPGKRGQPTLDKVAPAWIDEFRLALARKNITRIRRLGVDVGATDPYLSEWLQERAGLYDLDSLKKLIDP